MLEKSSVPVGGPPAFNHTGSSFLSLLRRLGRREIPHIFRVTLEELLSNDPDKDRHIELLNLFIAAAKKRRWDKSRSYWILRENEYGTLLGALWLEGKPTTPALQNLSTRHSGASLLFEVKREEKRERVIAILTGGKLEIITGNEKALFPFLGGRHEKQK